MQLSASDAPFQFNFGAPSENSIPSLKAFGVEEQKASSLSSVEVRPPVSVSCGTSFRLPEDYTSLRLSRIDPAFCSWLRPWHWIKSNSQTHCTFSRYLITPSVLLYLRPTSPYLSSHNGNKSNAITGPCQQCCSSLPGSG